MWAVAGVHPEHRRQLCDWIVSRGDRLVILDRYDKLPVRVGVDEPERVGVDRLLNAVAAKAKLAPGQPAVLVDAGSAVTVDWLDEEHVFRGGTIFPGIRLMTRALHAYTAQLPDVRVGPPAPAACRADRRSRRCRPASSGRWSAASKRSPAGCANPRRPRLHLFLTGGDAEWIVGAARRGGSKRRGRVRFRADGVAAARRSKGCC